MDDLEQMPQMEENEQPDASSVKERQAPRTRQVLEAEVDELLQVGLAQVARQRLHGFGVVQGNLKIPACGTGLLCHYSESQGGL